MKTFKILPKAGQVIRLSDDLSNSWSFGIRFLLAGNRVLCEWLGVEPAPPNVFAKDLKFSIPYENGINLVPTEIEEISWDKKEFKFALDTRYEFVQRRSFYRHANPLMSVQYKTGVGSLQPALVEDVGGGGMGIIVDRIVKRGTTVDLEMILPGGEIAYAIGEAVRVSAARKEKGYLIGVSFRRISEVSRDKIIKYVFQEQLIKERLAE